MKSPHSLKISVLFLLFLSIFLYSPSPSEALNVFYELFVVTAGNKQEIQGIYPGGQTGASLASGDINGDQQDDLIIGSPFASTDGKEWNGNVKFIISGGLEFELSGKDSGDQFGTSLETGDFNNDGMDDIAVGAHNAYTDRGRTGKVYVFYGREFEHKKAFLSLDTVDKTYYGYSSGDAFGITLKSGDINNDSITDLMIGAPFASSTNKRNSGVVYGYLGSKIGLPRSHDIVFRGTMKGEKFGSSIISGYFDKDDKLDIIFGAYSSSTSTMESAGKVYFYKGRKNLPTNVKKYDSSISGNKQNEWFSFSLEAGDINNDKIDDVIVSSFPYKGYRGDTKVSIFLGKANFLRKKADVTIQNPIGESLLGSSLAIGDLNKDGYDDVLIGAPAISKSQSTFSGDTYIFYGGEHLKKTYDISLKQIDTIIHGENMDDWFGYSVEVFDHNSDGFLDIAVGARYWDGETSNNDGKVYIFAGKTGNFGNVRTVLENKEDYVTRAELVSVVVNSFDIRNKKSQELKSCYEHKDFCLFNFSAITSYKDLQIEPELVLYPDVPTTHNYYEDINLATVLGVVQGYTSEENSPFHPEKPITRIGALKVLLGANDLVEYKYKFELISMMGSYKDLISQKTNFTDINTKIESMWWYPRYVNFAVDNGIVNKEENFRPDDFITDQELYEWITRTLEYLNKKNEEINASGNTTG